MKDVKTNPGPWTVAAVMMLGALWWAHSAFLTASPSRLIYQYPQLLDRAVSCQDGCLSRLSDYALDQVRPGQTVYRYVEYCLDRPASGRVLVRFRQPSYSPPAVSNPNVAEVGCHKRFFRVQLPDDLIPGEPVTVAVTVQYDRETMPPIEARNPDLVAMVTR